MMTREKAHEALDNWIDNDCVGNIWFYKAPRSEMVNAFYERTIKSFEMSLDDINAMKRAYAAFKGASRIEIIASPDGTFDRVKVVKEP